MGFIPCPVTNGECVKAFKVADDRWGGVSS